MGDRYFTPAEVDAMIPALSSVMEDVMHAHAEATAARERLRAERARIQQSGGGVVDRAAWHADGERVRRSTQRIQDGLDQVVRLGGTPKDLSLGLVDFPALRDGRVVNLCWRHGETAVGWWHSLDEGYAGRKRL